MRRCGPLLPWAVAPRRPWFRASGPPPPGLGAVGRARRGGLSPRSQSLGGPGVCPRGAVRGAAAPPGVAFCRSRPPARLPASSVWCGGGRSVRPWLPPAPPPPWGAIGGRKAGLPVDNLSIVNRPSCPALLRYAAGPVTHAAPGAAAYRTGAGRRGARHTRVVKLRQSGYSFRVTSRVPCATLYPQGRTPVRDYWRARKAEGDGQRPGA